MTFLKNDPRACATLKEVFLGRFELLVAHFGHPKSQNALKMGCFGTKYGSKMGQNGIFLNLILDHLGCTNGWNEHILNPFSGKAAPQKSKKP